MFAYPDAARYRLGANYQQLPSNRARAKVYNPYERDGRARIDGNYGGDPDYIRSELRPVRLSCRHTVPTHEQWHGKVQIYSTGVTEKDFEQPRALWELIQKEGAAKQFTDNICPTLLDVEEHLRDQVYGKRSYSPAPTRTNIERLTTTAVYFAKIDQGLAQIMRDGVSKRLSQNL